MTDRDTLAADYAGAVRTVEHLDAELTRLKTTLTALADQWESDHDKSWARWADIDRDGKDCAAELRAALEG